MREERGGGGEEERNTFKVYFNLIVLGYWCYNKFVICRGYRKTNGQ